MRNILEYPITPQECIDFLERIRPQFTYEATKRIGGHDGLLIDYIQKALMDKIIFDQAMRS
jgi:hypothetical protein